MAMNEDFYIPGYGKPAPVSAPERATITGGDATATMTPMQIALSSQGLQKPATDTDNPQLELRQGPPDAFRVSSREQDWNLKVKDVLGELIYRGMAPASIIADYLNLPEDSKARFAMELLGPVEFAAMAAGVARKATAEELAKMVSKPKSDKPNLDKYSGAPKEVRKINTDTGLPFTDDEIRQMPTPEERAALQAETEGRLRAKKAEVDQMINSQPIPENVEVRTKEEADRIKRVKEDNEAIQNERLRQKDIGKAAKDIKANRDFVKTHKAKADSAERDAERLWGILKNLDPSTDYLRKTLGD